MIISNARNNEINISSGLQIVAILQYFKIL